MRLIKLAAAALNQTPLDWDGNRRHILAAMEAARAEGASILCLPELCVSGYGCEDAFLGAGLLNRSLQALRSIAPESRGMIVALGLPLLYQNRVYNTACLLVDGQIAGFTVKRFLAGDGIHYEPRWFTAWPRGAQAKIELDGRSYPIGDVDFDCGGVQIGFEICEEAWVAERPGIALAQRGVDVILNPSASHFAFAKHGVRQRFVLEGSRAFSASYVYANLLGNEAGRVIYDGDLLIASGGQLLAMGKRLSFSDWQLITATVDVDLTRMGQGRTGQFQPNPASYVSVPFSFSDLYPHAPPPPEHAEWEDSPHLKEEEFARAVSLGLFDYLRKSRSQGFVVSLSGGADSAAIACLIRLMLEFAAQELHADGLRAKLSYLKLAGHNPAEWTKQLLACVYQASANSSEITRNAAETVAQAVGAAYFELDISRLVECYVDLIQDAAGEKITWQNHDLPLQNIQARVRSPSVWLLANLRNALLLATSNRSEAAVGYATMDGDTSGGLSPLNGIDKDFLRRWLTWLEQAGPLGGFPIPELYLVNVQAPTAELRPGGGQTDEADLMPYEILNAIEKAAIRDRQTPWECYCRLRGAYPALEPDQLLNWIERFFQLWSRNQWKRERFAPGFHLDDENLDPRSWCRFPILSGGFSHELIEMRERAGR
jgi:NAD+ synthase (glutamine-hydrolysing)